MSKLNYNSYIICTSPRSGSTMLCDLLAKTGVSGNPDSYFHKPSLTGWLGPLGLSKDKFDSDHDALKAAIDVARIRGTGNTGIFGLRMQQGSFNFFMQQVSSLRPKPNTGIERIEAVFGPTLFIHLTRLNKLDQAISRVKAKQTGLWHQAADGTELERQSPPKEPHFDADDIERHLKELTAFDETWHIWFQREKITPLTITYEKLSADPTEALANILEQLGLNRGLASGIKPTVAKLANATNQNWAELFQVERGKLLFPEM